MTTPVFDKCDENTEELTETFPKLTRAKAGIDKVLNQLISEGLLLEAL